MRRAFLCGVDRYSGQSFEHRKGWVEDRILDLGRVFSLGVYAYAVMSNHVHVVVHVDPGAAMDWSPQDVAGRWLRLFPVRGNGRVDEAACELRAQVISADPQRVALYRARLSSLSWFMRCLSEPIARRANREDACTGRFWEGRFKCQALLVDAAVLACMAYVDLNPVRAGIANDLTDSRHTSVSKRIEAIDDREPGPLLPLSSSIEAPPLALGLLDYLEVVDWTGRAVKPGKRGAIAAKAPPVLMQLGLEAREWRLQVLAVESRYWRAVGTVEALLAKAQLIGQCWLKGCGTLAMRRGLLLSG